ncbi:MAG: polyprenyl synthetase family protein, partial [Candidatus Nanopelagicales bacterium]|nr:polyprenyl synthetase family protein [Candidatus Nanopelagicales bacterium]
MPNLAFLSDPSLRDGLQDRLARVESRLTEAVKSDYPFVTQTSAHLVEAGGKRFRPLMTLLCAGFGDPDRDQVYDAATVVELTHLATLYHDDVMDEAPMRRGRPSANSRWDNSVAILTGDFLFSRASDILADLGPEAVRIQARTFERLVTGQIRETVGPTEGQDPVAHHLQVLADKTGSLIATSAQFGAKFAGCDDSTIDTLTLYGERIGVAFQLADDLVDLTSDSARSGKTPGTDLKEGVPTLAGLMVLNEPDGNDRLVDLLSRPLSDAEVSEALLLLRPHPAVERARAVAR